MARELKTGLGPIVRTCAQLGFGPSNGPTMAAAFSYDSGRDPIVADSGAAVLGGLAEASSGEARSGVVMGKKSGGLKHLFAGWAPMRPPGGAAVVAGRPAIPAEI